MKSTILNAILYGLIAIMVTCLVVAPFFMFSNIENNLHVRVERMQVIEVHDGVYAVIDSNGEVWEFSSDRTYFVDEVVTVRFNTLGTESIYDDEIISVR